MAAIPDTRVEAVRAFNRFYTRRIGVLSDRMLDSPYSLTEMRVLYELAHREATTAAALARDLGLDAGYLSRILRRFETRRLLTRETVASDARQSVLRLTARGRQAFKPLDSRARQDVATLLDRVPPAEQRNIVGAMATIERILASPAPQATPSAPFTLRAHQPGDMGWVAHRHGAIYAHEFGYNHEFEALVARIVADFLEQFDPAAERCWMAERGGDIVGSVFLVRKSKTVAKLRLLLVESSARGLGLGARLVDECIAFARSAGYRKITLWTNSELEAARALYKRAGFKRVKQKPYHGFGKDLVAETWELDLRQR